jgi:hypothetical protein
MNEKERFRLREELAALEHEQWAAWAKTLMATEQISDERRQRWTSYLVPYEALPEEIRDHDRVWADRVLAIVDRYLDEEKTMIRNWDTIISTIEEFDFPEASGLIRMAKTLDERGLSAPVLGASETLPWSFAWHDDKRRVELTLVEERWWIDAIEPRRQSLYARDIEASVAADVVTILVRAWIERCRESMELVP